MTRLIVSVGQLPTLDAGDIMEAAGKLVIHPPSQPMIDQVIERLDTMPHEYLGFQTQHLGVGLAALCVRWGTYLATLMDESTALHPDLAEPARQSDRYSFITDSEMKRMNIEVSYSLFRLVQLYRERGIEGLNSLLSKAYLHLPMPYRTVRMDRELGRQIVGTLAVLRLAPPARRIIPVAREYADRTIANVLALWGWRNTAIEDIHAGTTSAHPLSPHQQRMRPRQASHVLREISSKFASHYFWFETYFGDTPLSPELPCWPKTATALANSFLGAQASYWSLTDSSSLVTLPT